MNSIPYTINHALLFDYCPLPFLNLNPHLVRTELTGLASLFLLVYYILLYTLLLPASGFFNVKVVISFFNVTVFSYNSLREFISLLLYFTILPLFYWAFLDIG